MTNASTSLSANSLLLQGAGATGWGAFWAVTPFEFLVLGGVIWLPFLVWREKRRSKKYGFNPGLTLRAIVAASILAIAAAAPVKHLDHMVAPVNYSDLTVNELCSALQEDRNIPIFVHDSESHEQRVSFSTSVSLSRRDFLAELSRVTDRRIHFFACGNGSSVLLGITCGSYYLQQTGE